MALSPASSRGSGTADTLIFDSTLGADAASFSITPIAASYNSLRLALVVRATGAVNQAVVKLQCNGDVGNTYDYEYVIGTAAAASASTAQAGAFASLGDCPGASATANRAASMEAVIPGYAGTVFEKDCISRSGHNYSTAVSELVMGHWRSTAAITALLIFPSSGNFLAGSRCTVWGVGTA